MRLTVAIALAAGLALLTGLIVWQGAAEVAALVASAGAGLLLVSAVHLAPVLATTLAWRSLLLGQGIVRPLARLFWWRWLGDAVNALLPVAQVGGEVVRGQRLMRTGIGGAVTGAAIVVDLTLGLVSLVVFILGGALLILVQGGGESPDQVEGLAGPLAGGLGVIALMIAALLAVQRGGLIRAAAGLLERHAEGRVWQAVAGGAAALHHELAALYRRRGPVVRSLAWRMAAWLGGAAETWVALAVLGHPAGPAEALILESMVQLARNAGFVVPGALGVQEGGLVLAGGLVGLGPEVALALSLVRRVRDLMLGLPALLAWQVAEGRLLWRRRATSGGGPPSEPAGSKPVP